MNKTEKDQIAIEFIARAALLISLVALAIDVMLPALSMIGSDFGVTRANDNQLIITALFLGLAFGQLLYGPLSDSVGRKPAIYIGLAIFMAGTLLSIFAWNFAAMLVGRFIQGLGVSGPRIVTWALVRDQYEGRSMARIMSFVNAVFIIVPVLAPALGQGILFVGHWRMIFVVLLGLSAIAFIWLLLRQEETLAPEARNPFSLAHIARSVGEAASNRFVFGYALAAGCVYAPLLSYLSTAPQIFQGQYGLGTLFPVYFGAIALSIGCAAFLNGKLVMRYGMRLLSWRALQGISLVSLLYFAVAYSAGGTPPLWSFMTWGMVAFFCLGLLFANFSAMAMEPVGHIAGVAAAFIGTLTMAVSLTFGTLIGQAYNGSLLPFVGGFAGLGLLAMSIMNWVERGNPAAAHSP